MRKSLLALSFVLSSFAISPLIVHAQLTGAGDQRGMVASATESVSIKPERLRLTMWVKAKASDAKSAVIALAEQKERVSKELVSLKADKESIKFSPTRVGSAGNGNERQQMMRMYSRSMRNQSGGEAPKMPVVVEAYCAVRAEWPLPIREGDALALLPATLSDQIEARDLAGNKVKPAVSEEEQESMEEMEAMLAESYSYSEDGTSGPDIKFIANIDDEMKQSAIAAAYKKAVESANKTSSAIGIQLGKLTSVNASVGPTDAAALAAQYYSRGYGNQQNMPVGIADDYEKVVTASFPDELSLAVVVALTYDIFAAQP